MFPITTFDSFEQMLWLNTLNHFLVLKCQLNFLLPELAADSITSVWKHPMKVHLSTLGNLFNKPLAGQISPFI